MGELMFATQTIAKNTKVINYIGKNKQKRG